MNWIQIIPYTGDSHGDSTECVTHLGTCSHLGWEVVFLKILKLPPSLRIKKSAQFPTFLYLTVNFCWPMSSSLA